MFDLDNNVVVISPDKLALPFFKVIWDRDKSKDKQIAYKELSYVFYYCDYKSPYSNLPEEKRKSVISVDIIRDNKWKPDKEIIEACKKYKELTETSEMRLLKAWENKIDEVATFLTTTQITEDNLVSQLKSGTDMEKIITSVQKLREVVEKQISQSTTRRGNKSTSMFEED